MEHNMEHNMEHENCSTFGHEHKPEHGRSGLCQSCYRTKRRHEADPKIGTRKPGPTATPGATSHRAQDPQQVAERRAARKAAKTHCVNGHELTEAHTYVTALGQKVCKLCQRAAYQKYKGREVTPGVTPIGPRNADKTHCPANHEYAVWGRNRGGADKRPGRYCSICHRYTRIRNTYGVTVDQWDAMVLSAQGRCDICCVPMEEPHIDHNHGSGAVRGLLCTSCNNGLGRFDDDPARLEAAAAYTRDRARS